ncbi:MAG: AMMECR1 domain-containing protein, partial [Spirochaetia bacterium]|nr:AMMECR1 domain-containing protein [Spirochaetia bacterium]
MEEIHTQILLRLAREALESYFGMKAPSLYERLKYENKEPYTHELGCFVTLHKKNGELCGCIGNLWGKGPLLEEIPKLARAAAFSDPRFHPLKQEELSC